MVKLDKSSITKIPQTTGVYQFVGKGKKILYVGKAINLKARLASHFENAKKDPKEELILLNSSKIKTIATPSEFQALLLEAELIKKHKPKYNRAWKDDKSYLYIQITDEEFPKVLLTRGSNLRGYQEENRVFGPFPSQRVVEELIHQVRKVVPFCTRKKLSKIPCFHSKIGLCSPCPNEISNIKIQNEKLKLKHQYRQNIRQVVKIFQGKAEPVFADLKKKMEKASKEGNFEEALRQRNHITRFEELLTQTLRVREEYRKPPDPLEPLKKLLSAYYPNLKGLRRIEAYDISNLSQREPTAAMVVATDAIIDKSQYRKFRVQSSEFRARNLGDVGMLAQVFERRFKNDWPAPDLIVVDGGKPQVKITQLALEKIGKEIPVIGIAKAPDRIVAGTERLSTIRPQLSDPGFNLIQLLRDEAHRFSRKYHRFLRSRQLIPRQ